MEVYWLIRMIEANKHVAEMRKRFKKEIEMCVGNTVIYDSTVIKQEVVERRSTDVVVVSKQITEFIFDDLVVDKKTAILNFASYTVPGGGFTGGSPSQEADLCMNSILYPVLREFKKSYYAYNRKHCIRGIYELRALYSPDVLFMQGDKRTQCDVLTCASPNWQAEKQNGVSWKENLTIFKTAVEFLFDVCADQGVKTFVVGPWGCGAHRQDPEFVARTFMDCIRTKANIDNVIFVVPEGKGSIEFIKGLKTGGVL